MPMDYDDNDFQSQNLHLAGEGSSTVSPVLHPYSLPKFDFDDNLQGHLRFDSLVENEVFLGITSQEDNQWIEEYSRGSSGIEFSSSAAESRRNNVWSEATSSESVEMLLKSVGQEERVVGETVTEELEASDEPGSLATTMDPNLEQDDGKDLVINAQKAIVSNELQENFSGFNVTSDCENSHVRFTSQSQEAQISGQALEDLVVLDKKCNLPVVEEKVDRICDDANQEEAENLANKIFNNELQEDFSTSKVGCGDMGSPHNFTGSSASDLLKESSSNEAEYSTKSKETSMEFPIGSDTMVETSTYSAEKPSVVSNVESVVKTSFEISIPINEESTGLMPMGSCNLLMTEESKDRVFSVEPSQGSQREVTASPICSEAKQELNDSMHEESLAIPPGAGYVKLQATKDGNTKSEILGSPESNVSSPAQVSHMEIHSVEETENAIQRDGEQATSDALKVCVGNDQSEMGEGSSFNDVGTNSTTICRSAELLAGNNAQKVHSGDSNNKDQSLTAKHYGSVQVNDEIQSSEPGAICMDQNVTSNERGDARLPSACSDTDIEVLGLLDSRKNVESTSSAEETTAMAQGSEADMTILTEPFAAVKSNTISSTDTQDGASLLDGKVATDDIATKAPLLGVSSMHHDNEKGMEVGVLSGGSSQSGASQIASVVDCASEGPLSVVEKGLSPDHAGKVVHGMVGLCAPPVENINTVTSEQAEKANPDGLGCSTTLETSPLPLDSSAKVCDNVDSRSLQDKKSMSGYHGSAHLSLAVDMSDEQQASIDVASPSNCDANHKRQEPQDGDSSASLDKPQHVSPSETNSIELSQSAKDAYQVAKGVMHEKAPLPERIEGVEGEVQSVSSKSEMRGDKSVTFEVNASAGLGQSDKGLQSVPAIQLCNLSRNMEGSSSIAYSNSLLEPGKSPDVSIASPQTPSIATIQVGGKENPERKTRRKSAGKESAKKGNRLKEATPRQSGRVEKSSASLTPPATGHVIQFEELKTKENVDCSITKPISILPIPTSNLLDLNNSTSIFQQPFTDNQQVQLRAQILVYGSLISGTPPEEPHMIAAFGQSDGGRKAWEATWRACLERLHGQKSQANNPNTPMQSRSDLKDAGHKTPDPGKHGSLPSKVLSSPIGGASNKGTPSPVVNPLIPLSSPLWNMSTPSVVFPSTGMPRTALHDYRQSLSPLHHYQTQAVQNFAGHNPPWLSQGPFAGQWVASSPVSAFNAGACFSTLPITEAVKLTPVKVSGAPGIKHTYSVPVVHSAGPNVFSGVSSLSDAKKATVSSGQASSDSKSRKRKKVAASMAVNQIFVPSQALVASVATPLVAHLPQVPHMEGHSQTSLLAQNQTDSVTAPVVSIFSTSTTPASITSKSSPGRFLSGSSTHDHCKKVETVVVSEALSKVGESKVQAEDAAVHAAAAVACQPSSDSKSIKRKKVSNSLAVNQTAVPKQASVASVTAPLVAYLPQVFHTEGHSQISLLAQNQTDSVSTPVVSSRFSTSVAVSTPVPVTSSPGRFPSAVYPASTYDYARTGYQKMEKAVVTDETLSKVKESKLQAENAAMLAAAEVGHCQSVWSQLERQKGSGVVSHYEAKLLSSAAVSVAKMAADAAKIASNVAEQARLMADEVFMSSGTGNFDRGSMISHPNVVNKFDKATPASISKTDRSNPNSIISAAREAARRRIEAASAASKHAENLDAIVKAAELSAEAVSQAGKIVAMGDPSALRKLVEAGPQGFWKTPHLPLDQQGQVSGHLNSSSDKENVEAAPYVSDIEIQTLKYGLSQQERSGDLAENQMMVIDGIAGSIAGHKCPDLSKTVGVTPVTDIGSRHTSVAGQNMPQSTSGVWQEHNIKEDCLVEVYKDDAKYKAAWLAAEVLSLKDEKALVCYTEIQSDEEKIREWVPLEVEGTKVPRIRIAHPMTTMRFEGTRKRRRTAVTDYAWSNGDRVDVWIQDCWREAVVTEPNTIDVTSLTVRFPAQGETLVVRSWYVRPTLIWNDGKWIEWSSLKGGRSTKGETPKEKRIKLGSPTVKDKRKDKSPKNVDLVESERHEELGTLPLSAQESSFTVGKSTRHENKINPLRTMRSGLQDGPRVIFGVPKPGKKQKFMDMSKHYVSDGNNKNNTANDSMKFAGYLKQQAPGPRGWRINSRNDAGEKQVTETKSRLKSRKPPVPSFRTLAQKDNNLISSKSTTHEAEVADKSDRDSVSDVENLSGHQNQMEFGSSSNTEDATRGPVSVDAPKKALSFTSNAKSDRLNKGKLATAGRKTAKVEVKDKSIPEVTEPRRSNRRIQPTSRLLEGLQSSLTVSKIPSVSHASQRSHNKVTSKGNTNHG